MEDWHSLITIHKALRIYPDLDLKALAVSIMKAHTPAHLAMPDFGTLQFVRRPASEEYRKIEVTMPDSKECARNNFRFSFAY